MDKGAIRKFAVSARNKLMEAVAQKAFELGITKDTIKEAEIYQDGFMINQKYYKQYQIKQREKLIQEVNQKGYDQVIEEVAYTWFNRFIALRFMEVNDYLPTGIRIFTSIEEGKRDPDALTEVLMLADDLDLNEQKVYELQDANDDEDLFKYILIKQCNKLGEIMPMMFEKIEDYTELLLPDNLLVENSVIRDMVTMIDEADWLQEVEIIGWLYQYYISEKKDAVFADLKKNKKITKENIPAATELFTPRWIVQYMVDNSLGRLWLESHPDKGLQEKLPYYLESAEQPENVVKQLEALKDPGLKPESITFFDPCMGSGHILVYAFEVFYELYKSQGYREQDIPQLIIENNLYGMDIDPRAAQMAYFAVMMKARSYNYRLFEKQFVMNLRWIEESNHLTEQDIDIFVGDTDLRNDVQALMDTFTDAKLYGSIIEIPEIDLGALKERVNALKESNQNDMFEMDFKDHALPVFESLIKQAEILSAEYDVVVTNPPYMGGSGMNSKLAKYLKKRFPNTRSDLFATMMERIEGFAKEEGLFANVTMQSWMFLSSFKKYRKHLLNYYSIVGMTHMANMVMGIAFGTAATIFRKKIEDYQGVFQYVEYKDILNDKPYEFPVTKNRYSIISGDSFNDIPGSPIAYWASDIVLKIFSENPKLGDVGTAKEGLKTGSNETFLRFWHEVNKNEIGDKINNLKWFFINKGGRFRKWYGNNEYVVNFENNGQQLRDFERASLSNEDYYFREGITWSDVTSGGFSGRYSSENQLFETTGPTYFIGGKTIYTLALMNSNLFNHLSKLIMSTFHFKKGDMEKMVFVETNNEQTQIISTLSKENIFISKSDWDSFETSWDYKTHPFIEFKQGATKISGAFANWQQEAEHRFQTLKSNEEELNRIFIDLYGLQDELTSEVQDDEVTVNRADLERDVKSFISYTVGLMLGRYSLDEEGLAYAGGEFDSSKYQSFQPDPDNVIPIADDVYFEDDIVGRFITILKTVFGEETLEENLDFIADALTRKVNETSRERIRRYFLKEFYKDHVKIYQKRPIYWLFDSGKENGFKALVYLHRYEPGLVSQVRTQYLHAQQRKYEEEIGRMDMLMESDVPQQEKTKAKKAKEKLQKQLLECQQYDQVIAHVANQQIDLDLDDGVKVNYARFQNVEVPQGEGKSPLKANVLAKI
ncbi:BREX-1 system adenine-specific DNA-methyltransferase PglX [Lentibacillus salinarum]|uniref:site-specific DNA-methyltransferase (adenine-specific) n=1 Tax=Lentibacillus salinarum TaxID=446820 RepID=A0ABW3ZY47_9BACI